MYGDKAMAALDDATWSNYVRTRGNTTMVLLSEEPGGRGWRVTTRQSHRRFGRTVLIPARSATAAMRCVEKAVGAKDGLEWDVVAPESTRLLARFTA